MARFAEREKDERGGRKKKILLIDDEKNFGKLLKMGLENFGLYQVDVCTNGLEGLERIKRENYDVIILDVLMPHMEGQEVLRRIKVATQTPVVILSAYLPSGMEEEVVSHGAFACLRKPIEEDQLILVIHKALAASQPT